MWQRPSVVGPYLDEVRAGLNTGFGLVGDYGQELAYQRARDRIFEAERPKEATALQVAGSVAGGGAALRAGARPFSASEATRNAH